jgi:hypothetical protein
MEIMGLGVSVSIEAAEGLSKMRRQSDASRYSAVALHNRHFTARRPALA